MQSTYTRRGREGRGLFNARGGLQRVCCQLSFGPASVAILRETTGHGPPDLYIEKCALRFQAGRAGTEPICVTQIVVIVKLRHFVWRCHCRCVKGGGGGGDGGSGGDRFLSSSSGWSLLAFTVAKMESVPIAGDRILNEGSWSGKRLPI